MREIVVTKIGAEWCGPCLKLHENFQSVKDSFERATFNNLDITDVDPEKMDLMKSWGVTQVPSIVVQIDGTVKGFIQSSNPDKIITFLTLLI